MIFNMNLNNKTPQFNLINNTGYNNNMYMNNNANNNFGNYKQNNNFNNINNKITTNNNEVKTKPNPMAFNLDYLNKNLSIKATNDKKKRTLSLIQLASNKLNKTCKLLYFINLDLYIFIILLINDVFNLKLLI